MSLVNLQIGSFIKWVKIQYTTPYHVEKVVPKEVINKIPIGSTRNEIIQWLLDNGHDYPTKVAEQLENYVNFNMPILLTVEEQINIVNCFKRLVVEYDKKYHKPMTINYNYILKLIIDHLKLDHFLEYTPKSEQEEEVAKRINDIIIMNN